MVHIIDARLVILALDGFGNPKVRMRRIKMLIGDPKGLIADSGDFWVPLENPMLCLRFVRHALTLLEKVLDFILLICSISKINY